MIYSPIKFLSITLSILFLLNSCSYLPEEKGTPLHLREETGDYAIYYSSETAPGSAFLFIPGVSWSFLLTSERNKITPIITCWKEVTTQDSGATEDRTGMAKPASVLRSSRMK